MDLGLAFWGAIASRALVAPSAAISPGGTEPGGLISMGGGVPCAPTLCSTPSVTKQRQLNRPRQGAGAASSCTQPCATPWRGSGAEPWCFLAVPSVPRCWGGQPPALPRGKTQSHEAGAGCRAGSLRQPSTTLGPGEGSMAGGGRGRSWWRWSRGRGCSGHPRARGNGRGGLVPARGGGAGLSLVGSAGHRGRVRFGDACTRAPAGHRAKFGCVAVLGTISGASETTAGV